MATLPAGGENVASIVVRAATDYDDVATLLGPQKNPDGNVCFCLSYRLSSEESLALRGRERGARSAIGGGFPRVLMRRYPEA